MGTEPLAIWIARELAREPRAVPIPWPWSIVLWAWYSLQPGTCGHRLIEKAWHPAMRFKTAREAAQDWRTRVELHVSLGGAAIADMWVGPGEVDGYAFVPLDSPDSIAAEAAHMDNCLCTYGGRLAHNTCRLWGVVRDSKRLATLRLGRMLGGPLLTIRELRLAKNEDAPLDVWWAAMRWLHRHDLSRIDTRQCAWGKVPPDAAAWRKVWRPYWLAKRRIPAWLPLAPSWAAIDVL